MNLRCPLCHTASRARTYTRASSCDGGPAAPLKDTTAPFSPQKEITIPTLFTLCARCMTRSFALWREQTPVQRRDSTWYIVVRSAPCAHLQRSTVGLCGSNVTYDIRHTVDLGPRGTFDKRHRATLCNLFNPRIVSSPTPIQYICVWLLK